MVRLVVRSWGDFIDNEGHPEGMVDIIVGLTGTGAKKKNCGRFGPFLVLLGKQLEIKGTHMAA